MKCGRHGGSEKKQEIYPPPTITTFLQCSPKLKRYVRTATKALEGKKQKKGGPPNRVSSHERGVNKHFFF